MGSREGPSIYETERLVNPVARYPDSEGRLKTDAGRADGFAMGELTVDPSLGLSAREQRSLERSDRHHWALLASFAFFWACFCFSAWHRVSALLDQGVPGLTTLDELMALDVTAGATYDAFQVLAIVTVQKISNEFLSGIVMSFLGFAIYWQNRTTIKLWRSVRNRAAASRPD